MKESGSAITYEDRGGESPKTSIVIHGAANHIAGVAAEYAFLARKFGEQGRDWKLEMQAVGETEGRRWDMMCVKLTDGTRKTFYFDITEFYGKW